jgi:hypothetical protein
VCWLSLLTAAGVSAVFLLRNLAPFIVSPSNKQVLVLLSLVGYVYTTLLSIYLCLTCRVS